MNISLDQLQARLEACEVDLEAHRGYIKGMEYAVRTLIAGHPQPRALSSSWGMTVAAASDAHAGDGTLPFNRGLQRALSMLSDEVWALGRSSAQDLNGGESPDQEGYLGQRDTNDPK